MYAAVIVMAVAATVAVATLYGVQRYLAIAADPLVSPPYQSGWLPQEHALSRYHARWYLATLLFLVFDIEMLFMYPWSVVVVRIGAEAIIEMGLFLGILMLAVGWAWREGALRWA